MGLGQWEWGGGRWSTPYPATVCFGASFLAPEFKVSTETQERTHYSLRLCSDGGSVFYHHCPTSVLTTWLHLVLSLCHPPDPHTCPSTLWSDYPSLQGREPRLALCRVTRAPDCLERASGFIHHHPAEDWPSGVRTRSVTVENPGCTVPGCLGFCPGERPCSHE